MWDKGVNVGRILEILEIYDFRTLTCSLSLVNNWVDTSSKALSFSMVTASAASVPQKDGKALGEQIALVDFVRDALDATAQSTITIPSYYPISILTYLMIT